MADLSKLRFNGTDYNVKDASAPLRKFTNYSKTGNLPITSDDTTQTAIGKLENALNSKINTSAKGTSNGVAELDANGKVPSSQLPSYVDDVLEYSAKSSFPATGETGKIYVDTTTNKTYRWSGSAYVEISESLALGETSSTAYRGDRGKAAYDHSQVTSGNPHGTTGANTKLTGYSKGSSKDAVAATDTVNAAIAKHENRIDTNQSNILYSLQTGVKNLFNFDVWKDVGIARGTKTVGDNSITVTATSADAYTDYGASYPETVKIYVQQGDIVVLSWDYTPNNSQTDDKTYIFGFGSNPSTPVSNRNTNSQTEYLEYTVPATVQYVEIRFGVTTNGYSATYANIMICTKAAWDQEPNVYRPFARPNYDLTQLQAEDRAALAEQVDEGAKNIVNPALFKSGGYISDTTGNVNNSSNSAYMDYLEIDSKQTYYITPLSGGSGNWGAWYDSTKIFISGFNSYGIQTPPPNAKYLRLTVSYQGSDPNYESTFMICTKPKFDISSAYKPYALPNTDLTRLEAEDRASLAEVVDSGAKNLAAPTIVSGSRGNLNFTLNSDNSVSISGYNGSGTDYKEFGYITPTKTGVYVLSGAPSDDRISIIIAEGTTTHAAINNTYPVGLANLTAGTRYSVVFTITVPQSSPISTPVVAKPMVCTEADWKISQNYAPYRKNLDQLEATKAPALSGSITSGDLNDVTINTFAMYANTVSSLPTSENYYVETSVFDASSLLQRAYNIATAESYVRVKCVGTWSAWKQITNA